MPGIFQYGDILNITFTPDKELNILIYRSPSYLIIYRNHTRLKRSVFWPTLYNDDGDDGDDVYADNTTTIVVSSVVGAVALIVLVCVFQVVR